MKYTVQRIYLASNTLQHKAILYIINMVSKMKIKFMQKNVDALKKVEKEQSDVLYNRMQQYLTELTESHPETEECNKTTKKELKTLHDSGMLFKLFIEDNKYSYSGYMNDQKTYEMYVIEKDREVLEIGNINLIEDYEGTRSEYIILSGLDKGSANIWLGEYDYNYFEKGEQDYSLR